ncbi:MAG: hypothetical protein H6585_04030 [Flavobacteriales bacterium]|nr:hypothetical protein [Flavobacteriales bacterium]MCB9447493.1 hypothetical protein [Flavobacteriales bacterium]
MSKRFVYVLTLVCCMGIARADDSVPDFEWQLNGYVKDLVTTSFLHPANGLPTDNLIHNRINFKGYWKSKLTGALEIRNRLFTGYSVKNFQGFVDYVDNELPNTVDMSATLDKSPDVIAQSRIDRLYIDWRRNKFELTAGRQRINWGIALAWNPNDIFNAYSFFDFDYEERPGSDAIRVQYQYGTSSGLEAAVRTWVKGDGPAAACRWKFNLKGYDFQVITGTINQYAVWGGGWAGNIKTSGFKGEFSFFHPLVSDTVHTFSASATCMWDYTLPKGQYITLGVLYQNQGLSGASNLNLLNFNVSAQSLSPFQFTAMGQMMFPVTPLINAGGALMYSPAGNTLFLNPTFSWSVKENIDLSLVGQWLYVKWNEKYRSGAKYMFLRMKWNF